MASLDECPWDMVQQKQRQHLTLQQRRLRLQNRRLMDRQSQG